MNPTIRTKTRRPWAEVEARLDKPAVVKPDGLFEAPEFLVRLIGRQNAQLLELLSARNTVRSRRI